MIPPIPPSPPLSDDTGFNPKRQRTAHSACSSSQTYQDAGPDAYASFLLGVLTLHGYRDEKPNPKKAVKLLSRSHNLGDRYAIDAAGTYFNTICRFQQHSADHYRVEFQKSRTVVDRVSDKYRQESYNTGTVEVIKSVMGFFNHLETVFSLEISHGEFSVDSEPESYSFLEDLGSTPKKTSSSSEPKHAKFDRILAKTLKCHLEMKTFALRQCNISMPVFKELANVLEVHPSLTHVDFSGCFGGVEKVGQVAMLRDVLHVNPTVTSLNLSDNYLVHKMGLLTSMIRTTSTLQKLNLSDNNLKPTSAAELALSLEQNSSLTVLDLSKNNLGKAGFESILIATPGLRELHLRSLSNGTDYPFEMPLKVNPSLTYLNLSGNEISEERAVAVVEALAVNPHITQIDLESCNLKLPAILLLADVLRSQPTLRSLSVLGNVISEEGAKALASSLEHNSTLQTLRVSYGNWSSVHDFIAPLQKNESLTELQIGCKDKHLEALLQRNREMLIKLKL